MNKKYQVFISSTFTDLIQERQDTIRSVLDLGHIPSGMEAFPAADVEQFDYIKKVVDECDYYVLIIGARYGSTDEAGVSFTEKEYDYAVEQKKTVLAFIHNDTGSIPVAKVDIDPSVSQKLKTFRQKVSTGRLVKFWTSRDQLNSRVIIALSKAFGDSPGIGWVRGDSAATEDLLLQINALRNQNDTLTAKNAEYQERQNPKINAFLDPDCAGVRVVETRINFPPPKPQERGPDSKWVQIMVMSASDAPLIECEMRLIRVERVSNGNSETILTEPTFCTWSKMVGDEQKRVIIPARIPQAANLFSVQQGDPRLYVHTMQTQYSFDDEMQKPGKYRLTTGVYAKDCPTQITSWIFEWGGSYDNIKITRE
jgi:hypothetical protein